VEWGVAQLGRNSDEEYRRRVETIIEQYKPTHIAFEDYANGRRGEKAQRRIEVGLGLAKFLDLQTSLVAYGDVRTVFDLPLTAS
jgi:hypothetical protein